jgi:hypothetical protein
MQVDAADTDRAFDSLAARVPGLADLRRWPSLNLREAALLVQWEAPLRILGQFPNPPQLREELIAAASHGVGHEAHTALGDLLKRSLADERSAVPVPGEPVTFYLDQAGSPEWQGLTFDGSMYRLAVMPGVGVSFSEGST